MNRFGTYGVAKRVTYLVSIFMVWGFTGIAVAQQSLSPSFAEGGVLYADIDTTNHRLFVLVNEGLWQYQLAEENWTFVDSLKSLPVSKKDLEFGYNPQKECIQLWSRGIGEVHEFNPATGELRRVDNSHRHRNQFRHFPFYRMGTIQAFGGYGYWEWRNMITFFNEKIREWSLQNVHPKSEKPQRRIPFTGAYDASEDRLYIYGGETTLLEHPDDQYASHLNRKDVWKFSFNTYQWEKLMDFEGSEFMFFNPATLKKVGEVNSGSTSFFVPDRKLWFLPVVSPDQAKEVLYLKPVDLSKKSAYEPIQIELGRAIDFYPTNFMYDPGNEAAIIVGFDNLSYANNYPIRVIQIPLDSLAGRLDTPPFLVSLSPAHYVAGGLLLLGIVILLFLYWSRSDEKTEPATLPMTKEQLVQLDWLTNQEQRLLSLMAGKKRFFESQEIEEQLWGHQSSYDYRRRLRNDVIKSVNKKFQKHYPGKGFLVIRKKDPQDNRRYLYGIDPEKLKD